MLDRGQTLALTRCFGLHVLCIFLVMYARVMVCSILWYALRKLLMWALNYSHYHVCV